jgi:hypothetical protein
MKQELSKHETGYLEMQWSITAKYHTKQYKESFFNLSDASTAYRLID